MLLATNPVHRVSPTIQDMQSGPQALLVLDRKEPRVHANVERGTLDLVNLYLRDRVYRVIENRNPGSRWRRFFEQLQSL